jgi:hypothetical protein
LGDTSSTSKSRAEQVISDLRQKIEQKADTEVLKGLMNDLRGVLVTLQQELASKGQGAGAPNGATPNGANGGAGSPAGSDDVIDAEVSPKE